MKDMTYSGVHARLKRVKGRAVEKACKHCGSKAFEWAYTWDEPAERELLNSDGQKYAEDLSKYIPLCRRCHMVYDKSIKTHCPHGHPYSGDNLLMDAGKRKCRTCVYARNRKRKPTPEQQARRTELQRIRRARSTEWIGRKFLES